VPGSINIALSGQFASWAGGILGIHSKPVLIGDSDAQIEEARLRLARVGIEDLRGYLSGRLGGLAERLDCRWRRRRRFLPQELNQKLRDGSLRAPMSSMCAAKANGRRGTSRKCNAGRSIRFRKDCRQSIESVRLPFTARADIAA
jgi:hypothetical protein